MCLILSFTLGVMSYYSFELTIYTFIPLPFLVFIMHKLDDKIFEVIEAGIRQELETKEHLVFESIGLSRYFDQMKFNLEQDYDLVAINVHAKPELCLERIQSRDQSIHIPIPLETIAEMNKEVMAKDHNTNFQIDNGHEDSKALIDQISRIVNREVL